MRLISVTAKLLLRANVFNVGSTGKITQNYGIGYSYLIDTNISSAFRWKRSSFVGALISFVHPLTATKISDVPEIKIRMYRGTDE